MLKGVVLEVVMANKKIKFLLHGKEGFFNIG